MKRAMGMPMMMGGGMGMKGSYPMYPFMQGKGGMPPMMMMGKGMGKGGGMPGPPGGHPPGSWTCKACGNVNWPKRTTCNKAECGAPGPWTCPACNNNNFAGRTHCNKKE